MPRFARYFERHNDVQYRRAPSLADRLHGKEAAPCPSQLCRCDKRLVRMVCIQLAFADPATTVDAIPLVLPQTSSYAVECWPFPDNSSRPQTRRKYPDCGDGVRSRCCLSCAAWHVGEQPHRGFQTIHTCIPDLERDLG